MQKILKEWQKYLTEQSDEQSAEEIRKKIFAANGKLILPPEELRLLQRFVSQASKTNPLSAAQAAAGLSVYYKANNNQKFSRVYDATAKRLRGLSKYSGNKALTRATDAFLGANDPVVEKGIYNSKDRPQFAKFIADLAASVKSSTGIRILDPTLSTKPPEWAKKYPSSYKALQFTADFLVSDPMSLLSMAIPVGRISGVIEKKLAQGLRKEVSVGLQKAAQAAAKGQERATQQAIARTVQRARTTLEDRVADAAVSGMNKTQKTNYVAAKILEGNIETGVISGPKLAKILKKFNPNLTREQIIKIWNTMKPASEMSRMDPFDAIDHYKALQGQFETLLEKFDIGVDTGSFIAKFGEGDPKKMRWIYDLAKRQNIPIPATGEIAVGRGAATAGGKRLFRNLFHELGHGQLLKNYREVAETFYTEWVSLTERRIAALEKDIARRKVAAKTPRAKKKLAQKEKQLEMIKTATGEFKVQVKNTIEGGGDLGELFSQMDSTYQGVMNYLKRTRGSDRAGKLYFLVQPEETFAELFEKAARSVIGGGQFTSKNFPKSAAMIDKYAREVAKTGNLMESFMRIAEAIRGRLLTG